MCVSFAVCSIVGTEYMRVETGQSGEGRNVQVTVGLPPTLYSRLALVAHRHDQTLGDAIRAALAGYVEDRLEEAQERLEQTQRTITRDPSTDPA